MAPTNVNVPMKRNDLIEKAGRVTIAGGDKPISGAAELCVNASAPIAR